MCHHFKGSRNPPAHLADEFSVRSNQLVRSVGHHRMPVLLSSEEEYQLWLNLEAGRAAVEHLLATTDPAIMTKRPAKE
jgi:putative SOS response-associated peptidase YedK